MFKCIIEIFKASGGRVITILWEKFLYIRINFLTKKGARMSKNPEEPAL